MDLILEEEDDIAAEIGFEEFWNAKLKSEVPDKHRDLSGYIVTGSPLTLDGHASRRSR